MKCEIDLSYANRYAGLEDGLGIDVNALVFVTIAGDVEGKSAVDYGHSRKESLFVAKRLKDGTAVGFEEVGHVKSADMTGCEVAIDLSSPRRFNHADFPNHECIIPKNRAKHVHFSGCAGAPNGKGLRAKRD